MKFNVSTPDGPSYEVEAPSLEAATAALQKLGQGAAPPQTDRPIDLKNTLGAMSDQPVIGPMFHHYGAMALAGLAPLAGEDRTLLPQKTLKERYDAALKDMIQTPLSEFQQQHPVYATTANVGTALASAGLGGLATRGAAAAEGAAPGFLRQSAATSGIGGGIAATDALMRGQDPITAGLLGLGLGAVTPAALRVAGAVASPVTAAVSNIRARMDPTGYAERQVARGISASGITPAEIDARMAQAAAEGQDVYTAADAMGPAGQRMLGNVAQSPGRGAAEVTEAMLQRQAGQADRIVNQLETGFASPRTAAQMEEALTQARDTRANVDYPAARGGAGPVDLTPAIARIDTTLTPGVTQIARPVSGLANDSIEAALEGVRRRLTDGRSMLTDYTAVERVRGDLADQVQAAVRAGQGNRARLLGGVLREIDAAMERASPGFLAANRTFAQGTRAIEQVPAGRTAAGRGRPEDIIPAFQAQTPRGQQAFRAGYVDPLIEQAQRAAEGANKARPLTSDKFRTMSAAVAPGNPVLQRQLAREMEMHRTLAETTGNSATFRRLAEADAQGVDPALTEIAGHALTGNVHGALRAIVRSGSNILSGNTEAVRQEIGRLLLSSGRTMQPGEFQRIVDDTVRNIQLMQRIAHRVTAEGVGSIASQKNKPLYFPPGP